jgi:DNA-directed RNA polymerase I subunit RPA2
LKCKFYFFDTQDAKIYQPKISELLLKAKDKRLYPSECRQRHTTYNGKIEIQIEYSQDGKVIDTITRDAGYIPVMVKVKQ